MEEPKPVSATQFLPNLCGDFHLSCMTERMADHKVQSPQALYIGRSKKSPHAMSKPEVLTARKQPVLTGSDWGRKHIGAGCWGVDSGKGSFQPSWTPSPMTSIHIIHIIHIHVQAVQLQCRNQSPTFCVKFFGLTEMPNVASATSELHTCPTARRKSC